MATRNQFRSNRRGALTLEWILLVTVLVVGIIGGMAAVRNATNGELLDLANAISAINVGGFVIKEIAMKKALSMLKHPAARKGALALEWVLLITIVVIGVLGGLAAVRNATVQEITDLSKAVEQINVKTSAEAMSEGS